MIRQDDKSGHATANETRQVVSVVIVNWNSKAYVRDCVASLYQHCGHNLAEIIVIDSGSFDGCGEILSSQFPAVRFIQDPENIGFAKANNKAAAAAKGDFVLLLNPDTVVHPGAIDSMLAAFASDRSCGAVGALLLNRDGSVQTSCVQCFHGILSALVGSDLWLRLFPGSRIMGRAPLTDTRNKFPPADALSGAAILMRRNVFMQIGGFDERYFMYSEDIDLCRKVRQNGLMCRFARNARITHFGGGSSKAQPSDFSTAHVTRSKIIFVTKWHSTPYTYFYRACLMTGALTRMILFALSGDKIKKNSCLTIVRTLLLPSDAPPVKY